MIRALPAWLGMMLGVVGLLFAGPVTAAPAPAEPTRIILDADMWGDVDDAFALALMHAFQSRGEARLLAVTLSTDDDGSASYTDLLNRFYGRPDIPIGRVRGGADARRFFGAPPYVKMEERARQAGGSRDYIRHVLGLTGRDGRARYPHLAPGKAGTESAIALLRRTLAAQPDGSVVIVQIGYSTNLARLLDSRPDRFSPLDGLQLVTRKVRLLSAMAGWFAPVEIHGHTFPAGTPEFNVMLDVPSAQKLFREWPTPIVVSGFEIGWALRYHGRNVRTDFNYVAHHPLVDTYTHTDAFWRQLLTTSEELRDHPIFDQTAILQAVRPDRGYFGLSEPGTIEILSNGGARFVPGAGGRHRHLTIDSRQTARALELSDTLVSEPPRAGMARRRSRK